MGLIKKAVIGKFVKRVVLGIKDPVTAVLKSNIESTDNKGGAGKIDYVRLSGALATVSSIYFFLNDKISFEQLEPLLEMIYKIFF